jgi:hypothetical protein
MSATTWERTETSSRLKIGAVEFVVRKSGEGWRVRVQLTQTSEVLDDEYDDRAAAEAACEAWAREVVSAAAAAGIVAEGSGA